MPHKPEHKKKKKLVEEPKPVQRDRILRDVDTGEVIGIQKEDAVPCCSKYKPPLHSRFEIIQR